MKIARERYLPASSSICVETRRIHGTCHILGKNSLHINAEVPPFAERSHPFLPYPIA